MTLEEKEKLLYDNSKTIKATPDAIANPQIANVGFINLHLFAQPNSVRGTINQVPMISSDENMVIIPMITWAHIAGNWNNPASELFKVSWTNVGIMTRTMVTKFEPNEKTAIIPCLTKLAVSALLLNG